MKTTRKIFSATILLALFVSLVVTTACGKSSHEDEKSTGDSPEGGGDGDSRAPGSGGGAMGPAPGGAHSLGSGGSDAMASGGDSSSGGFDMGGNAQGGAQASGGGSAEPVGDECLLENGGCGDVDFFDCEDTPQAAPECTPVEVDAQGCDFRITDGPGGGLGTEEAPFLICNPEQLLQIHEQMEAIFMASEEGMEFELPSYYLQTRDIDLYGVNIDPIGRGDAGGNLFAVFYAKLDYDGQDFEISNLSITSDLPCVGLFSKARDSVFSNIRLTHLREVTGTSANAEVGSLLGCTIDPTGSIAFRNVHVRHHSDSSVVSAPLGIAGGLVGHLSFNSPVFFDLSSSDVGVRAEAAAGGLVGRAGADVRNTGNGILRSFATGSVTSTGERAGGLVGEFLNSGRIISSFATGDVRASERAGGLVGEIRNNGYIIASYATGNVAIDAGATYYGAGLVGQFGHPMNTRLIRASYATGELTTPDFAVFGSGLVGGPDTDRNGGLSVLASYFEDGREPDGFGEQVPGLLGEMSDASGLDHVGSNPGVRLFPSDVETTGYAEPLNVENAWGLYDWRAGPGGLPGYAIAP